MAEPSNVNKNMNFLIAKYGQPTIDYFAGGTWRLWFQDFHQHHGKACHGSMAAEGDSIEQAIMRLHESAKKHPPRKGFHCKDDCPEYSEDLY